MSFYQAIWSKYAPAPNTNTPAPTLKAPTRLVLCVNILFFGISMTSPASREYL